MVKSYIKSINEELHEAFTKMHRELVNGAVMDETLGNFLGDTIALLDYYIESIHKYAHVALRKKTTRELVEDKDFLLDLSTRQLVTFEDHLREALEAYLGSYDINNIDSEQLYEEVLNLVMREVVRLYTLSQLNVLRKVGQRQVLFLSHDTDCNVCKAKHGKMVNTANLIENLENYGAITAHLLCPSDYNPTTQLKAAKDIKIGKLTIKGLPVIWEKDVVRPLQRIALGLRESLPDISFRFVEDVRESAPWQRLGAKVDAGKTDKHIIVAAKTNNEVYISNGVKNPMEIIVRHLVPEITKDVQLDWWNKRYEAKRKTKHIINGGIIYESQFISKLAESSAEDYLNESALAYVLHSIFLKSLDEEAYEHLSNEVFKGLHFHAGWDQD